MTFGEYTPAERAEILARMREVSAWFYLAAQRVGCHAFIEFTGLMNEFRQRCERAEEAGDASWIGANGHDVNMPLKPYEVDYIREKLHCIYGEAVLKP